MSEPSEQDEEVEAAAPDGAHLPPADDFDDDPDLEEAGEALEADLAEIAAQRDDYLALAQRLQAEFENYKKGVGKRIAQDTEAATGRLVESLLPVLDACDGALTHGHEDVKPIYEAIMDALEKEGLVLLYPAGEPFDPNHHEAVQHEPGDGDDADVSHPVVSEVYRSGYTWKGRVLRPAMVKVKG
ncbi:MAG: molecular chaperone GrpE [Acidimicrobiaceae bacterium]|jgi:molecular chaperone GrpE